MDQTNFQQPLAVEKIAPPTFSSQLSVEEIFYTIQGEGPLSGQPACFIRLAGCNLQCRMCDSYFSSHVPFSIDQVMSAIEKIVPKHVSLVVVTGGEPFRQYYMPQLVERLLDRFATVQLETSGSCYQKHFDPIKWQFGNKIMIVCSPKTAKLHSKIIPLIDAYKYVIRAGHIGDDGLPNEEPQHFKKVPVAKPEPNWTGTIPLIYISPWDERDVEKNLANVKAAVESCLQHGYVLSLQIHKIVNLP